MTRSYDDDWDWANYQEQRSIDVYEPDTGYPTGILDAQGREIMRQRRFKMGFDLSKKVENGSIRRK